MFVLGILIFVAGLFLILGLSNGFSFIGVLFDLTPAFYFIVLIISVITATGRFRTFIMAINALFSKKYNISAADKEKAIRLFKLLGKSVVYATILFTVIGIQSILSNLSDLAALGPLLSTALCTISQGAFINLILISAINVLETRYHTEEKTVISEKQVIDKLLELCYKQGISPEDILNANEIHIKKDQ